MQHCYRAILRDHFKKRIAINSRYSLRAYAKHLDLTPSHLSSILSEKQGMSEKVAERVCLRLGFNQTEKEYFITSAVALDARSKQKRLEAQNKMRHLLQEQTKFEKISDDRFVLISDWYYYSILELIMTKDFQNEPSWIAKRLGIHEFEAQEAMKKMIDHGFIKQLHDGSFQIISLSTKTDISSESVKDFHRQVLNKANKAVDMQTIRERDFSTLTIGIDTSRLPEIKEMIRRFRAELNTYAEKIPVKTRDEVYVLSVNLFKTSEAE